jgi:hypothetical protein|tara:strand:- start:178 stop:414 length:237 start_codon:yes stop_codon:yes gene_type:complete
MAHIYHTKWTRARKNWIKALKDNDNDAMKVIELFTSGAAKARAAAREYPESVAGIRAENASNAATYGINLAFGKDLAK